MQYDRFIETPDELQPGWSLRIASVQAGVCTGRNPAVGGLFHSRLTSSPGVFQPARQYVSDAVVSVADGEIMPVYPGGGSWFAETHRWRSFPGHTAGKRNLQRPVHGFFAAFSYNPAPLFTILWGLPGKAPRVGCTEAPWCVAERRIVDT